MNVLCMDKTGTITKGTVELEGAYDADGKPSDLVFKEAYTNAKLQAGFVNPWMRPLPQHDARYK